MIAFQISTKILQKSFELFMIQKLVVKICLIIYDQRESLPNQFIATGKFTLNPNPKPSACQNLPVAKIDLTMILFGQKIIGQIYTYKFLLPPRVQLIPAVSMCQIGIPSHFNFFFSYLLFFTRFRGENNLKFSK